MIYPGTMIEKRTNCRHAEQELVAMKKKQILAVHRLRLCHVCSNTVI